MEGLLEEDFGLANIDEVISLVGVDIPVSVT